MFKSKHLLATLVCLIGNTQRNLKIQILIIATFINLLT